MSYKFALSNMIHFQYEFEIIFPIILLPVIQYILHCLTLEQCTLRDVIGLGDDEVRILD